MELIIWKKILLTRISGSYNVSKRDTLDYWSQEFEIRSFIISKQFGLWKPELKIQNYRIGY